MAVERVEPTRRGRGRPRLLTASDVAAAGLRVLDQAGLDGLTIAAVADDLGVSSATPYSYFDSKEALLNAVADLVIGEIPAPSPGGGLQRAREFLRSMHVALLEHPAVPRMLADRTVTGAGAVRSQEILLCTLADAGLADAECVVAYRVLLSYVTGFTQRRIIFERDPGSETERRHRLGELSRDHHPTLHRMLPLLDVRMSMDDFDLGLDQLLSRYRP